MILIVLLWLSLLLFIAAQMAAASRLAIAVSTNMRGNAIAHAEADGAANGRAG
nr:hypothetical protein [uncultured Rhodopila sp.]